jgi:transposase
VVQLATKALDEVRREHWNELRHVGERDAAKEFKDARWSLLKNPQDLTDRQADARRHPRHRRERPTRLGDEGDGPRDLRPLLTVTAVAELTDRLLSRFSRSRLKPIVRLGRTIRKHRDGILAARRLNLSNARAEGHEQQGEADRSPRIRISLRKRRSRARSPHLTCGPINLTLPHERAFV